MTVKEITSTAQFQELLARDNLFYVDFYADWCGPCKQISPVFERLAEEKASEGAEFYKVNIDDVEDLASALRITSIPTFHAYKGNKRLDPVIGANRAKLAAFVENGFRL